MLDRRVVIEKVSGENLGINEGDTVPFSELETIRNIIILGDPGSGKTELLRSRNKIHGGVLTKAANFLKRPIKCEGGEFYIDALDERRTSTNKLAMVDEISGKLWEVQPDKFRLASRKQDWLGDVDLEIFRDYFEDNGGYIVVSLMPLTDDELTTVLKVHNVESPVQFIEEAKAKKLDGLLQNPQNAIMLARAVSGGSWPSSRRDAFTKATNFLLREHNVSKAISGDVNFSADELRDTAGELCALRLIADLPGYRLHHQGNPEHDGLYYRDVRSEKQELISAALQRPVFRGTEENDCLDTVHRTLAEFMAGQWLASRIDRDLPPARLDALIGREGFPVTALRGLYAWLPVFSLKHCEHYLKADPMGILTNGDVFSLTLQSKRTLLKSLCDFASQTPWFNTWGEPAEQLKALGVPALKSEIMDLLESEKTSEHMRMALLRMISADLAREQDIRRLCRDLVLRVDDNFQEAEEALNALCSDWQNNRQWITDFMQKEDKTTGRLRLKGQIISLMPVEDFIPEYMASLMIDSLVLQQQIPLGSFYGLEKKFSTEHSLEILKLIADSLPDKHSHWRNATQVYYSISPMIYILLSNDCFSDEDELIRCLDVMAWFSSPVTYLEDDIEITRKIIQPYKSRIKQWVCSWVRINNCSGINFITFANELHHKTKGVLDYSEIISILTDAVNSDAVVDKDRENAYIAALILCVRGGPDYQKEMDILMAMADKDDVLLRLQENTLFTPISNHIFEMACQRKSQAEEKQKYINELNDSFKEAAIVDDIIKKSNVLHFASCVYWGEIFYVHNFDYPSERLGHLLLPENIDYITEEWKCLISSNAFPDFKEVIHTLLDNSRHPDGLCLLTAAEIYYQENQSLNLLDDNAMRVLLVLELTTQVMCSVKNGRERRGYIFPWLTWIAVNRITLISETLIEFLSYIEMKNPSYHFKQPLVRRLLEPEYTEIWPRMLHILRNDVENSLDILCAMLRNKHDFSALETIMHEIKNGAHPLSDESHDMWNTVLFITGSTEACKPLINSISFRTDAAFYLQELAGLGKYGQQQTVSLSAEKIQKLVSGLISCFPERAIRVYDVVVASDRSREHDGEYLISRLISLLAADSAAQATLCLSRLVEVHNESAWIEDLRQARQTQLRRRRDGEYTQPSWRDVIATLNNRQPANAADLHALLCEQISLAAMTIRHANTDLWKLFWNEGSHGSVDTPKSENSGTDVLINLLRPHLQALDVRLEPEMHMARDKRADIGATYSDNLKISVEVKRHYHSQVWLATENQLKKLYVPDPQSEGYGIFLVFWFGERCKTEMPLHPIRGLRPGSATEMELWLNEDLAPEDRSRIKCFVIDVSDCVK
ncbi:NACHT domain-containing protein [Pantoea ananatis]|uniref:NACHT domain-containing protein n=1 Tax=Pantoea ananas TaxID=553 RepID=UPI003FA43421